MASRSDFCSPCGSTSSADRKRKKKKKLPQLGATIGSATYIKTACIYFISYFLLTLLLSMLKLTLGVGDVTNVLPLEEL